MCEVYLQCGPDSASERALVDLLEQARHPTLVDFLVHWPGSGTSASLCSGLWYGMFMVCKWHGIYFVQVMLHKHWDSSGSWRGGKCLGKAENAG